MGALPGSDPEVRKSRHHTPSGQMGGATILASVVCRITRLYCDGQ